MISFYDAGALFIICPTLAWALYVATGLGPLWPPWGSPDKGGS